MLTALTAAALTACGPATPGEGPPDLEAPRPPGSSGIPSGASSGISSGISSGSQGDGPPAVLDTVRVAADLVDGRTTGVRIRSTTPLTDVTAEDPPGVRTRYVSWQRCPGRCDVDGGYDVEARRLLAQGLPTRYPVPAGTVTLVLAVRVDVAATGCVDVPALVVRDTIGVSHRLTGPNGGPVVRVC